MKTSALIGTSLALALALGTIGGALAQATYSADQVLQFFLKDKAAADLAKTSGLKRELCVGTAAECDPKGANAIARFDLLVNFDYNSAELTKAAAKNLDLFAAALKDQRLAGTKFAIDGHTDASGGEAYNVGLSERRAAAVVAYLAAQGVDAATLTAHGYGKSKPRVADPFSPENRRVETHLLD
jgi:OmpA-OmpF porin, OOP family